MPGLAVELLGAGVPVFDDPLLSHPCCDLQLGRIEAVVPDLEQ